MKSYFMLILWLSALPPGPNDLSLFQPKCPETRDLSHRLFVYYHAKACRGGICTNLAPSSSADSQLVGHFIGQHYVTGDVKVAPLYDIMAGTDQYIHRLTLQSGGPSPVSVDTKFQ